METTKRPRIDATCFVHPRSSVIGDVTLSRNVSVWPFASLRGDVDPIVLGEGSNVQDGCVIHTDNGFPVTIGKNVTLGHMAIVHGATVEDDCLIGIRAVVLNGAKIGRGSLVAAGALVTPGTDIPPNSLVMGMPGKVVKTDAKLADSNRHNAERYVGYAQNHRKGAFGSVGP
ncbi:MAG: gamma carbonic anhydrase family protein [Euryarchaeota archaeon]|nr:gamma carbonic anhydrase family protein [Euryarchaeota archaeon]